MGRGDPAQTRKRILDAASRLFYKKGIRAVGVDLIAAKAAVTKRTLYAHFPSKADLVATYLNEANEPTLKALIDAVTTSRGNVAEQVSSMFKKFAGVTKRADWQGCLFARAASEVRGREGSEIALIAAQHKHDFERWLQEYLEAANIKDAQIVARQLVVLLDGCLLQLLIHRDPGYAVAAASAAKELILSRM